MNKCKYNLAWVGNCNKLSEHTYCTEHSNEKCSSCGEKATHQCCSTAQFVCGYPLCDNCEHTIQSNGCNSGGELPKGFKMHCKKEEQIYQPWHKTT